MPYYAEKGITLLCDDLYLTTQGAIEDLQVNTNFEFTKHFISLNWRYTKHRQLVANFLAGENGHLSWYFKSTFDMLGDDLYFDLSTWETEHPSLWKQLEITVLDKLLHYSIHRKDHCKIFTETSLLT